MQLGYAMRAMVWAFAMAALLATAPATTAAARAAPRALAALERDIAAAMAHAGALRERLAGEPNALAAGPSNTTDIAGIADGGSWSSFAALRLAARGLDRRLETLRAGLPDQPPERAEIMLIMRTALGSVLWTIEDLPLATDEETETAPTRQALLDRLDRSLTDLAAATTAMAAFEW